MSTTASHAAAIRAAALRLGFARVGFAPVEPYQRGGRALASWLANDFHGEMAYLAVPSTQDADTGGGPATSVEERSTPRLLLDTARTLIVVALSYVDAAAATPPSTDFPVGFIARYARGDDYHEVIHRKLRALADECASILGRPVASRRCVDTAPLLEREAAAAGGLGFIAKSTLTIVPGIGSYVLLGELLVDVELTPDRPVEPRCGECTRCLVACPTGAFVDEYVLDARRCVSYLTIELRGPIARELRPKMGTMVVGCDVCQEVCPFNPPATPLVTLRPRPSAPELAQDTSRSAPNLLELLNLTTGEYRRLTRGRPLRRVSRVQLARNAAVALGNLRDPGTVSTLRATLLYHRSALVRGHVAWALGRLATPAAVDALNAAREREGDPYVLDELAHAGHLATAPTPS